jgi:hypothetical protein
LLNVIDSPLEFAVDASSVPISTSDIVMTAPADVVPVLTVSILVDVLP